MILSYAKGNIPVAVGTSIALETIFSTTETDRPRLKDAVRKYQCLCVNVQTLMRNISSACDNSSKEILNAKLLAQAVEDDINIIRSLCDESGIKLRAYYLSRKSFDKEFSIGTKIVPKTSAAVIAQAIQDAAAAMLAGDDDGEVELEDVKIAVAEKSVLFITSNPTDIISIGEGKDTALVKSYTGELIPSSKYNLLLKRKAKHKESPEFDRIRFNRLFIQLFGDDKLLHPAPGKVIDQILECAKKSEWTTASSKDRIRDSMSNMGIWKEEYGRVKF